MAVKIMVVLAALAASTAHAEPDVWIAQPPRAAQSGALVRFGGGQVESFRPNHQSPIALLMTVRPHVRVTPALQLDVSLGGEAGTGESIVLSSPTFAATWISTVDDLHVAARATASPAIASRLSAMDPSVASSLLAHDPLVAWPSVHGLGLQVSVQGAATQLWWAASASVQQLVPTDLSRQQTIVRADAAFAGPLVTCWTWAVELGASSDIFDEEFDEGTDIVPLWTVGIHHHRGPFSIGASTSGGYVGGMRGDLLGPTFMVDMRGPI